MGLIHHDQAQRGIGQEQRRARADHHLRAAIGHRAMPGAVRPISGECHRIGATPNRASNRRRKFSVSAISGSSTSLASQPHRFGHGLEIGLGLARSRHAVQQEGREGMIPHRIDEAIRRRLLAIGEHRHVMFGVGGG
jgi:hypothetical protein